MGNDLVTVDDALLQVQKLTSENQKLHEQIIGLEHQLGILRKNVADKTTEIHKLRDYEIGYKSLRGTEYMLMARITNLREELNITTDCLNSSNASKNRLLRELADYRKNDADTLVIQDDEREKIIKEFFDYPTEAEPGA